MQPIDVEHDPRRPYVQIAASIRAALLSGELEPGQRLPSVAELADFYGVAQGTIHSALRTLRDEGHIVSRPGAGTYVQDRPRQPVAAGETHELDGAAAFLFEMGSLKHLQRSGWNLLGIPLPESVAEHSFRVTMTAMTLAALEGADIGQAAALAAFHDGHETRVSDINSVGRAYLTTWAPEAVTIQQTADMPDEAGKAFAKLTAEYEAAETLEAQLARDADKLETLLQAIEYAAQGHDTAAWQETSLDSLRTDIGKRLAQAINAANPRSWLEPFQRSYHELRKASRGHADDAARNAG